MMDAVTGFDKIKNLQKEHFLPQKAPVLYSDSKLILPKVIHTGIKLVSFFTLCNLYLSIIPVFISLKYMAQAYLFILNVYI